MNKNRTIIAHRGLPYLAPENTLAGFELMKEYNIDWFETDITITDDGELVIIHDDFLARTTDQVGEVTMLPYSDVSRADAGSWFSPKYDGEKVPTMADLVDFINESKINLNLEVKGPTGPNGLKLATILVEELAYYLDLIDPNIKITISSFNSIMLLMLKEIAPKYERAILFERTNLFPDWQLIADACGAKAVYLENERLTKEMVDEIRARGYMINVWTVNNRDRANELFNWGVNGIITDYADIFLGKKDEN